MQPLAALDAVEILAVEACVERAAPVVEHIVQVDADVSGAAGLRLMRCFLTLAIESREKDD
jgi:hypothetical protein